MKYIAFIDTLGFTQRITQVSHEEAVNVIKVFNQKIYKLWQSFGFNNDQSIRGRTFSDSIIIHTEGETIEELSKILKFTTELYKVSITTCDLPLRGGLALGEFDDLETVEFSNLQKGLVVGTGFIDAYILESSNQIKGSKLLFREDIYTKITEKLEKYQTQKVKTDKEGKDIYELKWGDLMFLIDRDYAALNKFIELATRSKWLDHYFGTLETFLIKETSKNKKDVYTKIIENLKVNYDYNDLDRFIENYLKSENAPYTKRSFLSFIRDKI